MASASFVEIISHFAGYLQIFHDIARDRVQYDETLAPRPSRRLHDAAAELRSSRSRLMTWTPRAGPVPELIAGRSDGRVPRPSAQAVP